MKTEVKVVNIDENGFDPTISVTIFLERRDEVVRFLRMTNDYPDFALQPWEELKKICNIKNNEL